MEHHLSSSQVTVEYHDPHDVYKLLRPGLIPRLPLRYLHWQSHDGPLRSIDALHLRLVPAGDAPGDTATPTLPSALLSRSASSSARVTSRDDGFQTQPLGGPSLDGPGFDTFHAHAADSSMTSATSPPPTSNPAAKIRRHQIPGLRPTPYLKVLVVRCDSNETYKAKTRSEVRDWIKKHAPSSSSSSATSSSSRRPSSTQENHDAFEWLVVHVVIPNTAAATQPRASGGRTASADALSSEKGGTPAGSGGGGASSAAVALWRGASSTLLEKFRADFNPSSKQGATDRVAQVRIGINDVPYDMLPRVVPAVPTGYVESAQEAEAAWADLIAKLKDLILASFDHRVGQYEEDIRERDAQRALPGWNFCPFFVLKEGLAQGFESVGLVEDALVGYDQLSVGLDSVVREQAEASGSPEKHGGALLSHTEELKAKAEAALVALAKAGSDQGDQGDQGGQGDEETVDLQLETKTPTAPTASSVDITISSTRKPYRDLILANNVSLFDFRCYIFSRQLALLLRLANAWSGREELLAKLCEQQESMAHGVAPRTIPKQRPADERENLAVLAEICRRTLEFIPAISQVMRADLVAALTPEPVREQPGGRGKGKTDASAEPKPDRHLAVVVDDLVLSFAFSVAQQILAQTSTKSLSIPPSSLTVGDGDGDGDGPEPKSSIPEPKTIMHPARSSSLRISGRSTTAGRRAPSPNIFPGPGARRASLPGADAARPGAQFLKTGLEDLAARRAELYAVSRNILEEAGRRRQWGVGWEQAPMVEAAEMEEVSLDDEAPERRSDRDGDGDGDGGRDRDRDGVIDTAAGLGHAPPVGIDAPLLRAALGHCDDFYRLHEILTDKALRHYTVAGHTHAVQACMTDLGVLKFHMGEFASAANYFYRATPFFGESGWSRLELSMLVMYSRCLRELGRGDDHVKVVQKILAKAASAERQRLGQIRAAETVGPGEASGPSVGGLEVIGGFLGDLLSAAAGMKAPLRVPLGDFFTDVGADGAPEYHAARDSFSVTLKLYSLLVDELVIGSASLSLASADGGPCKDIRLDCKESVVLKPGRNRLRLSSNTTCPGRFRVDRLDLAAAAGKLVLHFERGGDAHMPVDKVTTNDFRGGGGGGGGGGDDIRVVQRSGGLNVRLTAGRDFQLGGNKPLDLALSTGWNDVASCVVRVRSATGGLRLLTTEAAVVDGGSGAAGVELARPCDPGVLLLPAMPRRTTVILRFPFSLEQDLARISVRLEVSFTTKGGGGEQPETPETQEQTEGRTGEGGAGQTNDFRLVKLAVIPVGLPLRVNVQDVFKHDVLLSRFNVMTAGAGPLRLFRSELRPCDVFEASFGVGPNGDSGGPVTIFPREPACLLYKVRLRKPAAGGSRTVVVPGPGTGAGAKATTMWLRLWFTVVQVEAEALLRREVVRALAESKPGPGSESGSGLAQVADLIADEVVAEYAARTTAAELERTGLLGRMSTAFVAATDWAPRFQGLGRMRGRGRKVADGDGDGYGDGDHDVDQGATPAISPELVVGFLVDWHKSHRTLRLVPTTPHSVLIPVAIPSVPTLHTADLQLHERTSGPGLLLPATEEGGRPVLCPNEPVAATLNLRWTRMWDTEGAARTGEPAEFSYEVVGQADGWLVGGRKRGHFVIPAPVGGEDGKGRRDWMTSTPETEAAIPLTLVPLREGWLSYPTVEIREVGREVAHARRCEVDFRNLGETVRVASGRERVTVSLDTSGPGGGPLVVESGGGGG